MAGLSVPNNPGYEQIPTFWLLYCMAGGFFEIFGQRFDSILERIDWGI